MKHRKESTCVQRGLRFSRLLLPVMLLAILLSLFSPAAAASSSPAKDKTWSDIVDVVVGREFTVGLRADGTVAYAGKDFNGAGKAVSQWTDVERLELAGWENYLIGYKKDGGLTLASLFDWQNSNSYGTHWDGEALQPWKNVKQVYISDDFCLGLHEDGTVSAIAADIYSQDTIQDLSDWSDIKQLATDGYSLVVGLKNDGTIVSTDDSLLAAQGSYWGSTWGPKTGWTDVEELVNSMAGIYAIKRDGTVLGMQREGWTDIDSLYVAPDSLFGLRSDGTVAADFSDYIANDRRLKEVASWKNIVLLAFDLAEYGRYVPVGLCADGTVRAVTKGNSGEPYGRWDVSGWSGVEKLYSGTGYTIGVRADGAVLVTGGELDALGYLGDIAKWKDIDAIYAAKGDLTDHIVGLKKDGTLVAAGMNDWGQCDIGA